VVVKTTKWDPSERLNTPEDIAYYLEAAFEDGDPRVIAAMLGDVARSKGMTQLARDTGLAREALYRALSSAGNPEFETVLKVMKALGLRLVATPLEEQSTTAAAE
jgi:probable addiction module antidote protein